MMWLLAIFSGHHFAHAQGLDSTRALARAVQGRGDYAAAERLWMRVQYFSGESTSWEVAEALAETHFQLQRYAEAAPEFDYAARLAPHDSLRHRCYFRAAAAWLLLRDHAQLQARLRQWGPLPDSAAERRRQFYLGAAAYGLGDHVMAEAHWGGCMRDSAAQVQLHDLFRRHAGARPQHPAVAGVLSAVVPGLGQLYLGRPGKALNAVLLVGAFAAGGVYMGAAVGIADAIVLFAPGFFRYYIGSAVRASRDARDKRQDRREAILEEMLALLAAQGLRQ